MLQEPGRIVAIASDELIVETRQKSACDSCNARSACGQQVLSPIAGKTHQIRVGLGRFSHDQFTIGDHVVLGIPEQGLVWQMLVSYLLPLVVMFAVGGAVFALGVAEWQVMLATVAGLMLGGRVSALLNRHSKLQLCRPSVVNKVPTAEVISGAL